MSPPFFVGGIDPGKNGGWSKFDANTALLIEAGPLEFDKPGAVYEALKDCREIVIERAQSAPGQGSQFEYGRAFGRTEAAIMMTGATIYYVSPSWWKGRLNVPADKELARLKALKEIHGLDKFVTLKKHDGIAEAALIAGLLCDDALFAELKKNNQEREKSKAKKKKRPSYRL